MGEYVYLLWTSPDYCGDGCCTRLRAVFLDETEALAARERLAEDDDDADHYVTRGTVGRVSDYEP